MMSVFQFKRSEEWQTIAEYIKLQQGQAISGCLNAKDHAEKEFYRGRLEALNDMATCPEDLMASESGEDALRNAPSPRPLRRIR